MAKFLLGVVTFEHQSGFPEDRVSNSFPLIVPDAFDPSADGQALCWALGAFYNNNGALTSGLYQWLSPGLSRTSGAVTERLYDVSANLSGLSIADGGVPRGSPIWEEIDSLGVTSQTEPLPEEVALVLTTRVQTFMSLSVEGAGNTRPRQRGSGRIYLGPWSVGVLDDDATNRARPRADVLQMILEVADQLKDDLAAIDPGIDWAVWSRAAGVMLPVEQVQVDDAFDTQRRRGVAPTSRLTLDI